MADRGRGGNQPPRNPAAVSAPGSGRRTDGGAGSKSQPIRVPTGGAYGQTKAAEGQQAAAPMAGASVAGGGGAPSGGQPPGSVPGGRPEGIFGATEQPSVQPGATVGSPRQMMAEDPQMFLRMLYSQYPTAAIGALLRRGGGNA